MSLMKAWKMRYIDDWVNVKKDEQIVDKIKSNILRSYIFNDYKYYKWVFWPCYYHYFFSWKWTLWNK